MGGRKRAKMLCSATFFTVNLSGVRLITFPAIIRTTIFKASGGFWEQGFFCKHWDNQARRLVPLH